MKCGILVRYLLIRLLEIRALLSGIPRKHRSLKRIARRMFTTPMFGTEYVRDLDTRNSHLTPKQTNRLNY